MRKLITTQNDILIDVKNIPDDTENIKTFVIDNVPEIISVKGKLGSYAYNPITKSLDVVYISLPPTDIDILKIESAQANAELFEMMLSMLGGM